MLTAPRFSGRTAHTWGYNMADLKIQDANQATAANLTDRIPVSQGDLLNKTITVQQIVDKVPATDISGKEDVGVAAGLIAAITPASIGAADALTADENYVTDAEKAALPNLVTIEQVRDDLGGTTGGDGFIRSADDHLTIVHNDAGNTLTLGVVSTICIPPTAIEFGSTTQQYDVTGSTFVSAVAGGTLGGIPASSAGNTLADCLAAIAISRDGLYLNVQEKSGAASATNPSTIQFLFSGVTKFSSIETRTYYIGSVSHNVNIQLWNFVTSAWDTYASFAGETDYVSRNLQVFNDSLYISAGVVKLQFIHTTGGIATHEMRFDYVELCEGGGGSGSASIASAVKVDASGFNGNLSTSDTNMQLVAQKVDDLVFSALQTPYNSATGQTGSVWNSNITINPANGLAQTVPIGADATTGISMSISQPADLTKDFKLTLRVIRPAGNQRVITLLAGDANIISSGGLLSSGDVLPSSGASTTDWFEFYFDSGLDKYIPINALFDVKA